MPLEMFNLNDRVALVTGGSRGLGLVMAEALSEAGASVAVVSRDQAQVLESAESITRTTGQRTIGIAADVTERSQVDLLVETVIREFGRIDILVNNAGTNVRKPTLELEDEDWDVVQNTNLKAPFLCSRAVAPYMKAQGYGRIINVSSMLGMVALAGRAAYCSSKGGLIQLTKTLALEWAGDGITVNTLCPGPFATDLNLPVLNNPEANQFFLNHIPLGRWGQPKELKGSIMFLSSDASSFMTGSTLVVDGGWTAE